MITVMILLYIYPAHQVNYMSNLQYMLRKKDFDYLLFYWNIKRVVCVGHRYIINIFYFKAVPLEKG